MNHRAVDAISVGGYLLMVAGLLLLVAARSVFSDQIWVSAIQLAAVGLMIWSRITFGMRSFHLTARATEGGLVTQGPYRFIRHPIYASVLYFTAASVAGHFSLMSFLIGLMVVAGAMIRVWSEERSLLQRYPEYAAYALRTKRFVPFLL
jgi:protein-S-isoprenylcysteine O-methyltransferase Ste14